MDMRRHGEQVSDSMERMQRAELFLGGIDRRGLSERSASTLRRLPCWRAVDPEPRAPSLFADTCPSHGQQVAHASA